MRGPRDVVEPVLGCGCIFHFAGASFHGCFYGMFQVAVEHVSTFKFVQPRRACGARGVVFLIRYNCVSNYIELETRKRANKLNKMFPHFI